MKTPCENPACGHVDDSEHPAGHICPQPRADKPGADLVALFDAVAALPAMPEALRVDLTMHGIAAGAALRAWAAGRGLLVEDRPLYSPSQGAWTFAEVKLAGGRIGAHEKGIVS